MLSRLELLINCYFDITMLPAGSLEAEFLRFQAASRQHRGCIIPHAVTQSSAPEVGQNNCPKNVEPIGIINKLLLLRLVGCLYYL
jgi:hypothetical protein